MRVLMVHNYYAHWGGEDRSTEQEIDLLRRYGHEVETYSRHNREIADYSPAKLAGLFIDTTWSKSSYQEIRTRLAHFKPDIVHVQNFFPLISPAVCYACADAGIPIVVSLRNYRLLCPGATLFRDGHICEECLVHKSMWPSLVHRCYRNSLPQTATVVSMVHTHRIKQTWNRKVDAFIACSEFAKQKLVEGGIPADRTYVRSNFLTNDPGVAPSGQVRDYAIFVGRLSAEKGVLTLLKAWQHLPDMPLKIVGEGPESTAIQETIKRLGLQHVELCGFVPPDEVLALIKGANLLIMPSEWHETFGRTIMEAFATGTPVLASRLGAMAELVTEDHDGRLFTAGDADDLARQAAAMYAEPERLALWGQNGRRKFESHFSLAPAYERIVQIYDTAIENHALRRVQKVQGS